MNLREIEADDDHLDFLAACAHVAGGVYVVDQGDRVLGAQMMLEAQWVSHAG